ncbi:MAG: DUF3179 domain-containing protein [Chloroflexi bacterium]|nr:DUF3179 domain-containing protein [Chloroflexota bacterium]
MNAMTWWDWSTDSVWSQPWGLALDGPLKGTRLRQLPMTLALWQDWRAEYPDTLVLDEPRSTFFDFGTGFNDDFVVGVTLGDFARSFPFALLKEEVVVNDAVGPFPIVLYTNPKTRTVNVYLRSVDGMDLAFEEADGKMRDVQTGSLWDPKRGLAVEGPLKGKGLQEAPSNSSFDWAWLDFYPHSTEYQGANQ